MSPVSEPVSAPTAPGTLAVACDGCGLVLEGGAAGCQAIFDAETARQYADWRFAGRHRMCIDTYALQHPDRYCRSAISFAAHLTGLCAAFDHPDHPTLLRDLQRWLSGRPALDRPVEPADRGALRIDELTAVGDDSAAYAAATERWARSTWAAYAALHGLAREWVAGVLR